MADQKSQFLRSREIHLCLVSDQQIVNIIPILYEDTRPQVVLLLVSRTMKAKSEILKNCLKDLGCRVYSRTIEDYDISSIKDQVLQALQQFKDKTVALNITGGTKIMALGAFEAMITASKNNQVFYLDSVNQQVLQLFPVFASQSLPELLDVPTALQSYGFSIKADSSSSLDRDTKKLTEYLIQNVSIYARPLAKLNYYTSKAGKVENLSVKLENKDNHDKYFLDLIELFKKYKLLIFDGSQKIRFPNEASRLYVNGGWLEDYVLEQVKGLKLTEDIYDCRSNLRVKSPNKVENEIDVAFTAKNRLHLIECKTVNYQSHRNLAKGDQAAYKLDSIRDMMAGTFGKAIIVSYQKMTKHDRQRCQDLGISLTESDKINEIAPILTKWINK